MKNKFLKIIAILLFIFSAISLKAQFGNVWAFGYNYGLDFNSGSPVFFDTTAINGFQFDENDSIMYNLIGQNSSSICDSLGNLLFYTDANKVWNRWHQRIVNDEFINNDLFLNTDSFHSRGQSLSLILPTNNINKFYLFTLEPTYETVWDITQENFWSYNRTLFPDLKYHIIDISANNGQGAVVVKNQLVANKVSPTLTATKHCNGRDWWIVAKKLSDNPNNNNIYASFLVTPDGIITNPVLSQLPDFFVNFDPVIEYLDDGSITKISPNGKIISEINQLYGFDLARFNNQSGVVTSLYCQRTFPGSSYIGGAFSADSKFFYLHINDNFLPPNNPEFTEADVISNNVLRRRLFKYSLNNLDSISIAESSTELIVNDSIVSYWNFQLAPDHKIYVTGALFPPDHPIGPPISKLFVIEPGIDTVQATNIFLPFPNMLPSYGLSNFPDQIFTNHHRAALVWPNCSSTQNDTLSFIDSLLTITHDYAWDFGDPASGTNNTSDLSKPTHQFSGAGTYTVSLTLLSDCIPFTIVKQITVDAAPPQTTITLFGGNLSVPFLPNTQGQWFLNGVPIVGATAFQYKPQSNGIYTFQITNVTGCSTFSNPFNFDSIGFEDLNTINQIKIYPNPAQNQLMLSGNLSQIKNISIFDISGKMVEQLNFNQQSQIIDISFLSNGTYVLQLGNSVYKKFVVCKD